MLGLQRGTVALMPHQESWAKEARDAIRLLERILGSATVEIQHVGSTSIPGIHAKPILDLAVGVRRLSDVTPYLGELERHGVRFRGEDVPGQLLFVMGDWERDTHHIHVVVWNSAPWEDYLNLRDYLSAFPQQAARYDGKKQQLARLYAGDRKRYTAGKQELIASLLAEARRWRESL